MFPDPDAASRKLLWAVELSPAHGLRHGGTLRMARLSRALIAMGHEVYALLWEVGEGDAQPYARLIQSLIAEDFISGAYIIPQPDGTNEARMATSERLRETLQISQAHAVIVGARSFLPMLTSVPCALPLVTDLCDCFVLANWREPTPINPISLLRKYWRIFRAGTEERTYTRHSTACLAASRVDKRCLDLVTGQARKIHVIGNGVDTPVIRDVPKIPGRLVFSGNMDFPPNYTSVLWFVDYVMPLLVAARQDIILDIAGQNPVPELLARASDRVRVLGFVEDMREVIARGSLFVAPMISGGGFKNKVLEAVASGTYVAATPMGVEFLNDSLKNELIVAASPKTLAAKILAYVDAPERYIERLVRAEAIVRDDYTWDAQAKHLAVVLETVIRQ